MSVDATPNRYLAMAGGSDPDGCTRSSGPLVAGAPMNTPPERASGKSTAVAAPNVVACGKNVLAQQPRSRRGPGHRSHRPPGRRQRQRAGRRWRSGHRPVRGQVAGSLGGLGGSVGEKDCPVLFDRSGDRQSRVLEAEAGCLEDGGGVSERFHDVDGGGILVCPGDPMADVTQSLECRVNVWTQR